MSMDLQKLKSLMDRNVTFDIDDDNSNELLVNYNPGNDNCLIKLSMENYKSEEELAKAIKDEVNKKLNPQV